MTTGSWAHGEGGDEVGRLRAQIGRAAFTHWYFWAVVGRRLAFWVLAASFLCYRVPMHVLRSQSLLAGWGLADVIAGAVIVLLPAGLYAFGHWTFGELTTQQRTLDLRFRKSGVESAMGCGAARHMSWDQIVKAQEGRYALYLIERGGGVLVIPKIDGSDPEATGQVRAALRRALGSKAHLRNGAESVHGRPRRG